MKKVCKKKKDKKEIFYETSLKKNIIFVFFEKAGQLCMYENIAINGNDAGKMRKTKTWEECRDYCADEIDGCKAFVWGKTFFDA